MLWTAFLAVHGVGGGDGGMYWRPILAISTGKYGTKDV